MSAEIDDRPIEATVGGISDDAIALCFAEDYADELRYVAAWGRWESWTGAQWKSDDTLAVFDRVRAMCREAARQANKPRMAAQLASAKTIAAVERLARSDRRIAATIDQWDADIWLLNTPGGIVDLRTGQLGPHDPMKYCTRMTAVAPGGTCPRFLAFLDRIAGGDVELVAYMQRAFGYALTGSTQEHALFFAYGTGGNGKSVLMSTVAGIFGDYHTTAPVETFIASHGERHPTDLAGLRGARLVTATETEKGRPWAEAKIKALTGGDRISARFMRQDFFEFVPIFKLLIAGNHKPTLRTVDEAIRRRFNLLPFNVTIPEEERDATLSDQLKMEWPGILAWMIRGCVLWRQIGLEPPRAVIDATAAYLQAEDAMATWIEDKCEQKGATTWTAVGELYASWTDWAKRAGEDPGTQKAFKAALEAKGFAYKRAGNARTRCFEGLKIKIEYSDAA